MDQKFALIFFGLCFPSCCLFGQYYYVNLKMTWFEAQAYCRQKFTDLASFESVADIASLNRPSMQTPLTWIGLRDDPATWKGVMGNESTSWRWSSTGDTSISGYSNWYLAQPDNFAGEHCVYINVFGDWLDWECNTLLPFICYDEVDENIAYHYVNLFKKWKDAQIYCQEFHEDLATIESAAENTEVVKVLLHYAWIGLYRIPFSWSDGSQSSVRNWLLGAPNNLNFIEHCACENIFHDWDDFNCEAKLTFLCHGDANLPPIEVKKSRMIKIKFEAYTDLSKASVSSQVLEQLGEVLGNQGWINVTVQWRKKPEKENSPKMVLS